MTVTYSSSRCRCDSTMVTGQCGLGGISWQKVNLCSCCALLIKEMSYADPSAVSKDALCTPMVGGLFCSTRRLKTERRGTQKVCPPPHWLTPGIEKWRACRPVTSQVYTASEKERGKVNIRYAW